MGVNQGSSYDSNANLEEKSGLRQGANKTQTGQDSTVYRGTSCPDYNMKGVEMAMTQEQAKQAIRARYAELLTPAKKRGTFICPLCQNGTGSDGDGMGISKKDPERVHLKCFKCGFYGDIIELVKQSRGLGSDAEAFAAVREDLGIKIDGTDDPGIIVHTVPPQEEEPERDFTEYFGLMEAHLSGAEGYLSSRGISLDTARRFRLGYDMRWIHPKVREDQRKKGSDWLPPASRRLIIPTSEHSYIARAIDPKDDYQKQKVGAVRFFNLEALYNAQKRPVFVTEGEIDALSIIEAGGLACGLGSANRTRDFLGYVEAHRTDNLILLALDNDEAGRKATADLEAGLKDLGLSFKAVKIYGDSKDANEELVRNPESFRAAIRKEEANCKPGAAMVLSFMQSIRNRRYEPVRTGLAPLDDVLRGGFLRQTLVTLGAAPGMGKTFFAQQVFEGMAQNGHNVLYFNLEMSRDQMLARSFARIARARENATMEAIDVLQEYRWTPEQRDLIEGKIAPYYTDTIAPHIAYNPGGSTADLDTILSQMEAAAGRAKAAGMEAPIVVIDYLHLLRGTGREDVQTVIKRAVDAFKGYAMRNNSIVLCIIAFNRDSNKDGKVRMESGRDTSAIEYSGDLMLGLNYSTVEDNTDKKADPEELRDKALKEARTTGHTDYKLKILKDRLQGYSGSQDMTFWGKYGLFLPKLDKKSQMRIVDTDLPQEWETVKRN